MNIIYNCRGCCSNNTNNLGKLPKQTHFAGRLLEQVIPDSFLYECSDCYLLARHPILSTTEYNALYHKASSKVWSVASAALRYDQKIVRDLILKKANSNCRVLDVGCYTADLLASLPETYLKYGVEMSAEAANVAASHGVKIIGDDLYNIVTADTFDVITAIDVIEHTENPAEFVQKLMALLEPNGRLILSTGNADNWLWRILKNRFWYSKFPEHISFIGDNWLNIFCANNNFKITEKKTFSYVPCGLWNFFKGFIKTFLSIMRINPERFSNTTKDHFLLVISKNG